VSQTFGPIKLKPIKHRTISTSRPLKKSMAVNTQLSEEQSYQALIIKQQPLHLD
jgi:hypothetical protein